jgi:hypothetical protein
VLRGGGGLLGLYSITLCSLPNDLGIKNEE